MPGALNPGPAPIMPQVGGDVQPAPGPAAPAQAAQPPMAPPQITHEQAVAALRHLSAIARELETFLQDPDLGKVDLKSKFIDGTTKLVAQRYLAAPEAVKLLGSVPADPQLQRQWVQQHFSQNMVAMNAVLDHHAAANPGTGDIATEMARSRSNPDNHPNDIGSVMAHYRGGKNA